MHYLRNFNVFVVSLLEKNCNLKFDLLKFAIKFLIAKENLAKDVILSIVNFMLPSDVGSPSPARSLFCYKEGWRDRK